MKKILILAANPIDKVRLRLGEEVREIENGLQRSQHRDQFVIKQQWATRTQDIHRAMLDVTPNIVHFCGHGEGEAGLVFEDKEGEAQFISTDALAGFFELFADTVDCVVLNACYSEVQAQAIAQHIDYVIGMSQGIGDQTAIEFAVAFYDALGAGRTVDFAYRLACNAIQMAGIDEHLIPVMIKREVHEGNNVQDDTTSAEPHEDQSQPIEKSGKTRKSLAFELNKKIVDFLTSIPNIHDSNNQRALLYSAGIDQALLNQINFTGPPGQFFQLLVPMLVSYGTLEDGREALEAVLEAAKSHVGRDRKEHCDFLIQEWRGCRQKPTMSKTLDDSGTEKAFIPDYTYRYDIFVSYAPVDDKPLYGAKEGWVTTLITQLRTQLASKLGREDAYSLWSDHQIPGNIPMSEMLNILRNSAMLIVVLSPGYLASEWCQRQKNDFLSMVKDRIRAGSRVFVVERDRLEAAERPPEFRDLRGYQFWVADREGRPPRVLGDPTPQRDEELYYERLNDLCYDLAQEFRRLKASATSSE